MQSLTSYFGYDEPQNQEFSQMIGSPGAEIITYAGMYAIGLCTGLGFKLIATGFVDWSYRPEPHSIKGKALNILTSLGAVLTAGYIGKSLNPMAPPLSPILPPYEWVALLGGDFTAKLAGATLDILREAPPAPPKKGKKT